MNTSFGRTRYFPFIILYVMMLHLMWAVCILFDAQALNATPLSPLGHAFGNTTNIVSVLICVSALSIAGLFPPTPSTVLMLMPQQALLVISASSSVLAAASASYADGVLRPVAFIAADQAAIILIAVVHMLAVTRLAVHMNLKI
jgi:hypothetical protein